MRDKIIRHNANEDIVAVLKKYDPMRHESFVNVPVRDVYEQLMKEEGLEYKPKDKIIDIEAMILKALVDKYTNNGSE